MKRSRKKYDSREDIQQTFKALGFSVVEIKEKCIDLLVSKGALMDIIQVVDGTADTSDSEAMQQRKAFAQHWMGRPPRVVRNIEDVLAYYVSTRSRN